MSRTDFPGPALICAAAAAAQIHVHVSHGSFLNHILNIANVGLHRNPSLTERNFNCQLLLFLEVSCVWKILGACKFTV